MGLAGCQVAICHLETRGVTVWYLDALVVETKIVININIMSRPCAEWKERYKLTISSDKKHRAALAEPADDSAIGEYCFRKGSRMSNSVQSILRSHKHHKPVFCQ